MLTHLFQCLKWRNHLETLKPYASFIDWTHVTFYVELFQGPALEWASRHRDELNQRGASSTYFALKSPKISLTNCRPVATRKSSLEMKLHRLNFVELLRHCGSDVDIIKGSLEAVQYARTHFANFVDGHGQEVVFKLFWILFLCRLEWVICRLCNRFFKLVF